MNNINIKEIRDYLKKNKTKSVTMGIVGLFIVTFILQGLMSFFSQHGNYEVEGDYSYSNKMDGSNRGIVSDMKESQMVNNSKSLSRESYTLPILPVKSEGIYNDISERKLVKNGNLSLVVKDIETAQAVVVQITKDFNGFVQSSDFSENDQYNYYGNERKVSSVSKTGYFQIKVPSREFENAFSRFKEIALKVNNESVSANDVTEQYSDLESKINNKKVVVIQYREIMKKSSEIEDILKVTQYLNNAQGDLDRLQGQMNRLSNQVELSTIMINIISEKDVEIFGVTWAPLTEIKQGFSNMVGDLRDFSDNVIAFVFKLPIYILYIGGVILAGRIIWNLAKKLKKRV
jgi:hypothetical protein